MTDDRTSVLVLGLGNAVCSDDGAGVAAVYELMRRYVLPEGVTAVDGGTLGLSLLPLVDSAERVIMLDAVRADAPAGTLLRLEGEQVPTAVYERLSPHQIGVADVLAGASLLDRYPRQVVLLGVVPQSIELGVERSPAVQAALPELLRRLVAELGALGYAVRPRTEQSDGDLGGADHVARTLGM